MSQGLFAFAPRATFPSSISSTHVELLMRDPYVYYARNVIKLKSLKRFGNKPSNADFGTLVHKIIEKYTKLYCEVSSKSLVERFLEIASFELNKARFSEFWTQKIFGLAEEFVEFDQSRRKRFSKVWSEQEGSIELYVAGNPFTLKAVADRIEMSSDGNQLCILDYKTGGVPAIYEVESGLAPQILISAMIAQSGGFKCLSKAICPQTIAYVKLQSFSPYWKVTELNLTADKLANHKEGLIRLLSFFITQGQLFPTATAASAYLDFDEYKHLSRQKPV
jgi:ATP-dependent helicase/nuclease subunit B